MCIHLLSHQILNTSISLSGPKFSLSSPYSSPIIHSSLQRSQLINSIFPSSPPSQSHSSNKPQLPPAKMPCIPWRLVLAALPPLRQSQRYNHSHKLDRATPDQTHRLIQQDKTVSHDDGELPAYQNQFLVHQYQLSALGDQLLMYQSHITPPETPQLAHQDPPTQQANSAPPAGTLNVESLREDFLSRPSYSSFFSQPLTPQCLSPPQESRPRTRRTPGSYQAREMDVSALMMRLEVLAEEQERGRVLWGCEV